MLDSQSNETIENKRKNMISRRGFLKRLTVYSCAAAGLSCSISGGAGAKTKSRPNVLFIISDDLCTALGGYRHPQCKTPNLDRLADRGVLFERAYCQFPVCGPSRASIMCGQYPTALGTTSNGKSNFRSRHPNVITLPQHLRNNGYYTARVSKIYHMGVPGDILAGTSGVDDPLSWDETTNIKGPEQYAPGEKEDLCPKVTHQGVDFVKIEADGDDYVHADGMSARKAIGLLGKISKPFFLAAGMVRPHVPLASPKSYFKPYPAQEMKLAHVQEGDLDDVPKAAQSQTNAVKYGMSTEQQRKTLSAYYAAVSYMDAQVGKILDALERNKLQENTIVVFMSDHGYNLGQHSSWQKLSLWEDSVRVPFIISVPRKAGGGVQGKRAGQVVELIDLFPTITELCGLKPPAGLPGISLCPLLKDPNTRAWKEKSAYTISRNNGESLRTSRWRYNVWDQEQAGVELYDHDNDPGEFNNLTDDPRYRDVLAELSSKLKKARARASKLNSSKNRSPR